MKKILPVILVVLSVQAWAQTVTITPALFRHNDQITVTYDVTGTNLASLSAAWAWVWIPGGSDSKYNVNPANTNAALTDNAKFTKSVVEGRTLFTLVFKPSDFFTADISTQTKMGILLKGNDWSNGQTPDHVVDFWDGSFKMELTAPTARPLFVDNGEEIEITAETPLAATFTLYIDGVSTNVQSGITKYEYTHTVTETSGSTTVRLVAVASGNSSEESFDYIISVPSPNLPRPAGIVDGINYTPGDGTTVTLSLWAPNNDVAYVRGDFSNWEFLPQYAMNKDGEHFWIKLTGLTAGQEYAFQYLVDETIYVADPYADKILDPDDQYIPAATYPSLKTFPAAALSTKWYFNRLSVFQTNQTPYVWQHADYVKPEREKLIIYELLVRDFFADGQRNYQNLIDTLGYFKRLGVNAIQLMPIMEFSGNDSWGYNPTFMFAPDKYYGTKNKFKEFIDKAHEQGIAVILDIAMNHQDIPNPYILMDFNYSNMQVNPTNKWFNVTATHPFSVFYDMNHESLYTKAYLDTVNHYWLNEYKVDGFRFDLSKGFTQTNNPTNVGAWSAYDPSRVAILKRMKDQIDEDFPEAYVILEHLADNTEETILSNDGFMLWGNMNYAYAQSSMGFSSGSDLSGTSYKAKGWADPNLISYMESHDEERIMVKNLTSGGAFGGYNIRNEATALERVKAASTYYYAVPGPKMLWQFGELGYDVSIDENGRTGAKPVKWDYYEDGAHKLLFNHFAKMMKLRNTYDVFQTTDFALEGGATLIKQVILKNEPFTSTPASTDQMNVNVVANFDLSTKQVPVSFSHTGTWYNYLQSNKAVTVATIPFTISMKPGEYALYTDVPLEDPVTALTEEDFVKASLRVYPNPVKGTLSVNPDLVVNDLKISTLQGVQYNVRRLAGNNWDVSALQRGLYIAGVNVKGKMYWIKLVKE